MPLRPLPRLEKVPASPWPWGSSSSSTPANFVRMCWSPRAGGQEQVLQASVIVVNTTLPCVPTCCCRWCICLACWQLPCSCTAAPSTNAPDWLDHWLHPQQMGFRSSVSSALPCTRSTVSACCCFVPPLLLVNLAIKQVRPRELSPASHGTGVP